MKKNQQKNPLPRDGCKNYTHAQRPDSSRYRGLELVRPRQARAPSSSSGVYFFIFSVCTVLVQFGSIGTGEREQ